MGANPTVNASFRVFSLFRFIGHFLLFFLSLRSSWGHKRFMTHEKAVLSNNHLGDVRSLMHATLHGKKTGLPVIQWGSQATGSCGARPDASGPTRSDHCATATLVSSITVTGRMIATFFYFFFILLFLILSVFYFIWPLFLSSLTSSQRTRQAAIRTSVFLFIHSSVHSMAKDDLLKITATRRLPSHSTSRSARHSYVQS